MDSGRSADRYELGPLIGQGGMGRVHAAWDRHLGRDVALKEALPGMEARLAREARITARLDHPNIVPVHDAGRTTEGRMFYAMRLVRGRSLAEALAAAPDAGARLRHVRTLLAVAEAVAFAHARGVIHRDLKPANILVGEFGETQVMDWGVARVIHDATPDTGAPLAPSGEGELTVAGGVVGTPRYMSPEQARGEAVDARSDVWSLGAVLHEILTGEAPYGGGPATALEAAREGRVPPLRARAPEAPPELAAVADQALQADPGLRYASAQAFAADLEAWLEGRRVGAHVYTPGELLARLVRAWRVPLGVVAAAAVVWAVGGAVATARVVAERDRARAAEVAKTAALADAESSLADALVARALAALEADDQATAELSAARSLTLRESAQARGVLAAYALGERPRLLERWPAPLCERATLGRDPRAIWCADQAGSGLWRDGGWVWRTDVPYADVAGDRVFTWHAGEEDPIPMVLDRATGHQVAETWGRLRGGVLGQAQDGSIYLADVGIVRRLGPDAGEAEIIGTCPDGARPERALAAGRWQVVACYDGTLLIWEEGVLRTHPPVVRTPTALGIVGDKLVVGNAGGALRTVDLVTGEVGASGESGVGPTRRIEPWPGGGVAVLGDQGVARWELETARVRARLSRRDLRAMAMVEGELWLLGSELERWSAPATPAARVFTHPNGVGGVAVDTTGERLLAWGGGGDTRVWSVDEGRLVADLRVQEGVTKSAAFGPDGQVVAVAATAPGVVWHTSSGPVYPAGLRDIVYKRVGMLRGDWVLLGGYDDQVSFVRWGGAEVERAARLRSLVLDLAVSPDNGWGVALDHQGGVYVIEGDPPSVRPFFTDPQPGAVAAARERLAVASENDARVYDRAGTKIASFTAEGIRDIALSADGRWLAAGHASGRTSIWDVTSGVLRAELHGHGARTQGLAFAPDGTWLATASWDGTVRRWGLDVLDAAPAELQRSLEVAWGRTLEDLAVE